MSLEGQVALVTGASRGIGKAIADALAKAGATVIGTATTETGAANISANIKDAGGNGAGMALNVNDPEAIEAIVKNIGATYGAPTILVNNAGITKDNLMMRMKDDEWDDVINTNLTAVYKVTKACLRGMMKAKNGRIINISSVVGASGNAGQTNYAATKAGVVGFTKSLAQEIGSRGVTVNAVAPGFIQTDMTDKLSEEQKEHLVKNIPLARLGQPEDIANAVLFLAGETGGYITGETIHVNGGMLMV